MIENINTIHKDLVYELLDISENTFSKKSKQYISTLNTKYDIKTIGRGKDRKFTYDNNKNEFLLDYINFKLFLEDKYHFDFKKLDYNIILGLIYFTLIHAYILREQYINHKSYKLNFMCLPITLILTDKLNITKQTLTKYKHILMGCGIIVESKKLLLGIDKNNEYIDLTYFSEGYVDTTMELLEEYKENPNKPKINIKEYVNNLYKEELYLKYISYVDVFQINKDILNNKNLTQLIINARKYRLKLIRSIDEKEIA